jgi:hypothetical protein
VFAEQFQSLWRQQASPFKIPLALRNETAISRLESTLLCVAGCCSTGCMATTSQPLWPAWKPGLTLQPSRPLCSSSWWNLCPTRVSAWCLIHLHPMASSSSARSAKCSSSSATPPSRYAPGNRVHANTCCQPMHLCHCIVVHAISHERPPVSFFFCCRKLLLKSSSFLLLNRKQGDRTAGPCAAPADYSVHRVQ